MCSVVGLEKYLCFLVEDIEISLSSSNDKYTEE